jgi:hypothetical protein
MSFLRRRDLLVGGVAGAGVLIPSGALAGRGVDRVERAVRRITRIRERIHTRLAPARAHVPPPEGGEPDRHFVEQLGAAGVAAAVYAEASRLSAEEQADPRMQQELWGAAEDMGRAVRAVADRFDDLDDDRWQALDDVVVREEASLDLIAAAIDAEMEALDLPQRSRRQLTETVRRQHFEVRQRGLKATMRQLLDRTRKVERLVARHADPLDALRTAAAPAASEGGPQRSAPAHELRASSPGSAAAAPLDPGSPDDLDHPARSRGSADVAIGALLLGLGIAGVVLLIASSMVTSGFTLLCLCVSIPLLCGSIICLAAGVTLISEG